MSTEKECLESLEKEIAEISGPSTTETAECKARDVLRHAAYDTVRGIAKEILAQVVRGEITDRDALEDTIHLDCDNACTYTADCYQLAWFLDEADNLEDFEDFLHDPTKMITVVAFANLRAEVSEMVYRSLSNCGIEFE